jgi:hypothetical protein
MDKSWLRHVQMQKMINPQVVDFIRDKEAVFPIVRFPRHPQYSLYKQYFRRK